MSASQTGELNEGASPVSASSSLATGSGIESAFPCYRDAIAIHNIGVLLLERNAYLQAMDTFKDAIAIISVAHYDPPQRQDVVQMLALATSRMAKPHFIPMHRSPSLSTDLKFTPVRRSHFDYHNFLFLRNHPIRIEWCDEYVPRDMEVDSAVMLYNFGLAHISLLHVQQQQQQQDVGDLRQRALRLFTLSHSILTKRCDTVANTDGELCYRILFITMLVLSRLIQILTDMHKSMEAKRHFEELVDIGRTVRAIEEMYKHSSAPAA